jgi:hypothetical protein
MESRNHKIKVSYGIENYHKFFLKHNKDCNISRKDFGDILREYNGFVRDELSLRGKGYTLPCSMGTIELRKKKSEVSINEDGSIKNTMAVNWQKTRKMWADSPEAKANKVKYRFVNEHSDGYVFRIAYLRTRAKFKNKTIYRLRVNRLMKRQLSTSIINKSIDAFVNKY